MQELLTKRRVIIGAVVVLFVLALNVVSSEARGFLISLSAAPQTALWDAGDRLSNFFGGGGLQRDIEELRDENFFLKSQIVTLQGLKDENEDFRNILELGVNDDYKIRMGKVIGKSITEDSIILRIGDAEGIQKGMPVITPGNVVIGRVTGVSSDVSQVQLISNKKSSFDAQISEKAITGVIRGEGGQKLLLDWVPQEDDLIAGDMVITSALGDIFPDGLLIGEITEVVKTGADPFQKARVRPYYDLRTLNTVFVIVSLK